MPHHKPAKGLKGWFSKVAVGAIFAGLALVATGAAARASQTLTYTDILSQLTDLDRLTRLHPEFKAGLFSSWDRNSRTYWGANGDAGQYLRVESGGEAVMMDIDGPGCIYRLWSANPQGKIRVYLDGDSKPTYEWDFAQLFTGTIPPFIKPLVYQRDGAQSASDCYLPIPFRKHIKVTADRAHGQYYQLNYLLYPKDWQLPSFHLPLSTEEESALQSAADVWAHPGRDPKPALPDQKTFTKTFTLKPHRSVLLADLKGPGMVRAIRVRASSEQRYYWRKLVLLGAWDKTEWPQVLTPLGPFFGFDWETAEYGSVIAGCQGGLCYFYYPMPFRRSARLALLSHLEQPAKLTVEIDWAPVKKLPEDTLYFFARWRQEPDAMTFDYPFLETAGQGQFVGVAMPIDHPLPGWWGEGDDKVWVDDDLFPPWIGTGSEDYFGDAWGIRYLPGPSFGASSMKDHRTCNYRWHFMDFVPFTKRFRMTIENYGPNGGGPRGHYEYTSTAFWYQAELTPPFEQLHGALYMGGEEPSQKYSLYEYHPDLFGDLNDDALRTYGLAIPFAQEAEDLFADAVKAHKGRIIADAKLPYEFDKERAVDFGRAKAGRILGECVLKATDGVVYFPTIYTAPQDGLADVTLEIEGRRLDILDRPQKGVLRLQGVYLAKGDHKAKLVAAGDGRAVVDCLQLQPAAREGGVMEAEEMQVARVTGDAPKPEPSLPADNASAGRFLLLKPGQAGGGMALRISPAPEQSYALGARAMLGPDAGIMQAFADGSPLGPQFDLYAPQAKRSDVIFPLGPMPKSGEVEIRAVGKNPQSQGFNIGLDYFRWEPRIIGPDSAEGVWARVLGVRGGGYSIQNLGPAWYGGHHLWINPSSRNAAVDIGLEIPREGDYEIAVRYTTSWDYGIVQASLDGKPMGEPADCYAPDVRLRDLLPLGTAHLTAGEHVLRFQAVDKNKESRGQGYLMGINYVTVREAK